MSQKRDFSIDESDSAMTDAATRLVLVTPRQFEPGDFAPLFDRALKSADIAAVILDLASDDESAWKAAVGELLPLAHAAGAPLLLKNRADLVGKLGVDGAHVSEGPAAVKEAQKALKPNLIVGAGECTMRHSAMNIGETSPDYVFLGRIDEEDVTAMPSLVEWWVELFEVPCIAMAAEDWGDVDRLIRARADFVALRDLVWADANGPEKALGKARALLPDQNVSAA